VLYYEYVHLTPEKWVHDLGEDFVDDLEFQLLSLANSLTQQSIKFRFDPRCLGLDSELKIKYFLNEFMIDSQNKMANFKVIEGEISSFFRMFK
jgi:hypothetical protein